MEHNLSTVVNYTWEQMTLLEHLEDIGASLEDNVKH